MLSKNGELFLTVAKSESISKAAEQLYISQPSLTKRMQQLEAQLGVALFDHKSRPLKLSPAGELYYEYLTRSAVQEHALLLDLREAASCPWARRPIWPRACSPRYCPPSAAHFPMCP